MAGGAGVALAGASIASSIFGAAGKEEAGEAQAAAFRARAQEERLAGAQQAVQRQQQLRKIMGAQVAGSAARGISVDSASFAAIGIDSYNKFAEDQQLADLETKLKVESDESQAGQFEDAGLMGAFGDLFGAATFFAGTSGVKPGARNLDIFGKAPISTGFGAFSLGTKYTSTKELPRI